MSLPTVLVALALTITSGLALLQSLASIDNLKKYETKAEQAADWSNTAKERLWKTRYVMGTSVVSCLVSLFTALAYGLFISTGGSILVAPLRTIWPALLALALHFGTARYMHGFWADKAKVPMLDQYNAAISLSMDVIRFVDMLSIGWGLMAVLKLFGL